MSAYSIIQYHQSSALFDGGDQNLQLVVAFLGDNYHASKWAEITMICIMIVSSIIFCFLAYKLYLEFGWHIYKKIGADLAMRGKCPSSSSQLQSQSFIITYYCVCRSIQNVSNLYDVTQVGLFLSAGPLGSVSCIAHCRMVARSNVR